MPKDPELTSIADQLRAGYADAGAEPFDHERVLDAAHRQARGARRRRRALAGAGTLCGAAAVTGAVVLSVGLRGTGTEHVVTPAASSTSTARTSASSAARPVVQTPDGPRGYDLPALFPTRPVGGLSFTQAGTQNALAPAFDNQTCSLFPRERRHDGVQDDTYEAPAAMVSQTQAGNGLRVRITISDPGGGIGYASIKQASSYCHFTQAQPATWITGDWEDLREGHRRTYRWTASPTDPSRPGSDTAIGTTVQVGALLVTASAQAADPRTARTTALAAAAATAERITTSGYAYTQSRFETRPPQWVQKWHAVTATSQEPAPRTAGNQPQVVR
ncbi:hypothetical protein [Luteipulveratus halotolerans]|uniref:Uncharacterized protein n=1 Tax=Luteipulveratus halotolerans TaxID=1631356 RepID=A0A0L6CFN9_9MICO|nr:hypothetical protein [Luteipulveratus halotolerans]KNX36353.1 hypothetical protein VV01_03105 [Luteipulveratus halotolerans]